MNLAETRRVIAESVATPDPRLQELLDYSLEGGKGLRPTLIFLSAHFGIYDALEAGRVAAAIELVHLASLVHDDILDGAAVRRNRPALYRIYGTVPAVLTGDYLFATAFGLLAKVRKAVLYTVTEAIRSMCSGEIGQLEDGRCSLDRGALTVPGGDTYSVNDTDSVDAGGKQPPDAANLDANLLDRGAFMDRGSLALPGKDTGSVGRKQSSALTDASSDAEAAYFLYIGQKTAALISAACRCGAILGRLKHSQQEALARFGWHLGLAYQIIDDYLDLFGSPEKMGKPCRQDLARGLLTLPVLRFLAVTPAAASWRERLARGLGAAEIEDLVGAARTLGCDSYTATMAGDQVTRALTALDRLPVNPAQDELALLAARTLAPLEDQYYPSEHRL